MIQLDFSSVTDSLIHPDSLEPPPPFSPNLQFLGLGAVVEPELEIRQVSPVRARYQWDVHHPGRDQRTHLLTHMVPQHRLDLLATDQTLEVGLGITWNMVNCRFIMSYNIVFLLCLGFPALIHKISMCFETGQKECQECQ